MSELDKSKKAFAWKGADDATNPNVINMKRAADSPVEGIAFEP